nr:uncharacterized protein LOC104085741 [Nicotiana tomentosiformis]XP_033509191.1 uncharacterized protein LOC104085741 [Nicotiana tomentosiformis]
MIEAPEELSRMTLPDKVDFMVEEAETRAEHPRNAPSSSGTNISMGIDDKSAILQQLKKLRKDIDKVGSDLGLFKKEVYEELGSMRELFTDSIKTVLQAINSQQDSNIDAKVSDSSEKNDEHYKAKNTQQYHGNSDKQVLGSNTKIDTGHMSDIQKEESAHTSCPIGVDLSSQFQEAFKKETAEKKTMHVHSLNQDANIAIQGEHFNEEKETMHLHSPIHEANVSHLGEDCNKNFSGEPVDFINVADSDNDSKSEKRAITLDDFELPENFSDIVKFGEVNEDETTLVQQGRKRVPGKHVRSPFLPYFSSGGSSSVGPPPIFNIKHPFIGVIVDNVDPDLMEEFNKWLYLGTDTVLKRKKASYTVKYNMLNPWFDHGVEKVDKKD